MDAIFFRMQPMPKAELFDHRKFIRLKRLLNAPTPHVVGYLECLWRRGYQTGSDVMGDAMDVEAAAEYPGEPGTFCRSALDVGFIEERTPGVYAIHDLYEHAPKYAKLRMHRKGTAPKVWKSVSEPKPEKAKPPQEKPKPEKKEHKPKQTPTPKPRNPLFDAVAEATKSDVGTVGSRIGKIAAALAKSEPPYTPAEVIDFSARFTAGEWHDWARGQTPTLSQLEEHIAKVRMPRTARTPTPARKTAAQIRDDELARMLQTEAKSHEPVDARRGAVVDRGRLAESPDVPALTGHPQGGAVVPHDAPGDEGA